MAVKMRPTHAWTKRPHEALLQLDTEDLILTVENRWEPSGNNGIPLFEMRKSNSHLHKNLGGEHCLAGSLTGEVASKNVTEAYKGWLIPNGNRDFRVQTHKPA